MRDNQCSGCGETFENAFEYVDHLTDDSSIDEFDPALLLPNGTRFMVGSLLRFMYYHAEESERIKEIAESSFVTLFAAEIDSEELEEMIEDMVVSSEMIDFDLSLKKLLEKSTTDDDESGA